MPHPLAVSKGLGEVGRCPNVVKGFVTPILELRSRT